MQKLFLANYIAFIYRALQIFPLIHDMVIRPEEVHEVFYLENFDIPLLRRILLKKSYFSSLATFQSTHGKPGNTLQAF